MSVIRNILNSTKALVSNSLPTTGSNTFVGTQTYSGSIIPATNNTYDLGSETKQFRHLYLSSGSLYIDGQKVLGSTGNELQITTDNGQSIKILEAGSDNIILQSADGNIELKTSGGGDVILDPTNGVIGVKGTMTIYSGNKLLSSDGNAIQFGNDLGITGSITTTGNINGVNLSTLSSSVVSQLSNLNTATSSYETKGSGIVSGSSQVVSILSSLNTYTGSNDTTNTAQNTRLTTIESVTGSYETKGSGIVSGSSQILGGSGVLSGSAQLPSGVVSGSSQVDVMSTTNIARLATTGSNSFNGNQIITGSVISGYTYNGGGTGMLHLTSNGTEGGSITFEKTSGTTQKYKLGNSGTSLFVYNETGANQPFTILNSGSIGIGTSSPIGPLDIAVPAVGAAIGASNAQTAYNYSRLRIKHYSESNLGLSIGYAGANHTYIQACYNEGSTAPLLLNPYGGDVRIGTSGLKFSNGSTNLNYYEEGSWTPQLYAGATAFTMGGINAGKYIRIGNQVTVCGHLQWSAGSGSGMVQIRGLPFTSSGVRTAGSIGAVSSGISFSSGYGMWLLVNDPGTSYIYIIQLSTSGQGYSHEPPVASSGIIYGFTLTYFLL
jgi:hypothetical protein